jgi:ribonuclease HI
MKLYIYSDGSVNEKIGIASSLLFTDNLFVGICIRNYDNNISSSAETELYGVLQSLEFIKHKIGLYESIHVYIDEATLVQQFNRIKLRKYSVPYGISYRSVWLDITKICRGMPIFMYLIKGHQVEHNPNKTCDRLCKLGFKFNIIK